MCTESGVPELTWVHVREMCSSNPNHLEKQSISGVYPVLHNKGLYSGYVHVMLPVSPCNGFGSICGHWEKHTAHIQYQEAAANAPWCSERIMR